MVVGGVLPGDGLPVLPIVHQGIEPMGRGNCRRENHQLGVVGVPPDDLLAPVPEKVGDQARGGFGAVVGSRAVIIGGQNPVRAGTRPFVDHCVVENFAL